MGGVQLQSQAMLVRVFTCEGKNYLEGYTLKGLRGSSAVLGSLDDYYEINDSDITMETEYYDRITDDKRGKITFSYDGSVLGETEILVERPAIEASSTDALRNVVPEEDVEVTYMKWLKRIIVILIILIIIFLVILLIVKIHKRLQYYQSKRSVRYYPISKDARLNKKKEKEAEKKAEKNSDLLMEDTKSEKTDDNVNE